MSALPRSDYTDAAERELPHWPGVSWRFACAAKHYRIVLAFNGKERFVVFSASGSDSRRGARMFIADLRAELRGMGAERDAPAKSPARGRPRKSAPPRPVTLPEITDPRPDGFAALRELQRTMQEASRPEPEWWARARVLRDAGLTQEAIAENFGVSRGAVMRALYPERYRPFDKGYAQERAAARAAARHMGPPRPPSPVQEAARLVREEGKRPSDAALATGAKLSSVYEAVSRTKQRRRASAFAKATADKQEQAA